MTFVSETTPKLLLYAAACVIPVALAFFGTESLAYIALGFMAVSLHLSRRMFNNLYSPLALMSFGWLLPSFFVIFLPDNYKFEGWEIRLELWIAVFLSFFSFAAGHFFYWMFFLSKEVKSKILQRKESPIGSRFGSNSEEKKYDTLITIFFIIGMIGLMLNLGHVMVAGGLSLYWQLGFRDVETIFGKNTIINYLYFLNPLVIILGTAYAKKFGSSWKITLFSALSFLALFFHGIKSTIVFPTIIAFIVFVLLSKKIKRRTILLFFLCVFLGFQVVTVGRNLPELKDKDFAEIVTYRQSEIYLYYTPSFANLQEELLKFRDFTGGTETLGFVKSIIDFFFFNKRDDKERMDTVEPYYLVNEAYNVGTYLRDPYRDFGYIGIIIFPFLYGFFTTLFYCNYLLHPSIRNLVIYSIFALMILISFFSNHFFKIQYYYWIIVLTASDAAVGTLRWKMITFSQMPSTAEHKSR